MSPNKNAFIESFFSIVEIEFMQTRYFRTYGDAYAQTVEFIKKYNECRIHGSLGFITPFALNGNTIKVVRNDLSLLKRRMNVTFQHFSVAEV